MTLLVVLGFVNDFLYIGLPISLVMAVPMFLALYKTYKKNLSARVKFGKIDYAFLITTGLWMIHFINYPFLRPLEDLRYSIGGYSVALILTYITSIFLPIVVTKNAGVYSSEADTQSELLLKAEQELVSKEKLASIGFLSAGLAHEVKNPLNIIYNGSILVKKLLGQVVRNNPTTDSGLVKRYGEIEELSSSIEQSCQEVNSVLKKLLSLTTGNSDAPELADLKRLIHGCIHDIQATYQKKYGFNVKVHVEIEELILIKLVKNDIKSVLENIIDNAFYAIVDKFKKGDLDYVPKIHVKGKMNGKDINITIRDNGKGIASQDRWTSFLA